jgi:hypothetical protein
LGGFRIDEGEKDDTCIASDIPYVRLYQFSHSVVRHLVSAVEISQSISEI